jgi:hypothetical protein
MSHRTLAQHYFLDALDLRQRFHMHWDDQPRKSSRIKSFVDLLMACECMLKAQCIVARAHLSLPEAYRQVRELSHGISKLAAAAEADWRSQTEVHRRATEYFGAFGVGLRYSVDAHQYFFPLGRKQKSGRRSYDSTLGNCHWRKAAEATVAELLDWGQGQFTGEVTDDIEVIWQDDLAVEAAMNEPKQRARRGDA